MGNLWAKMAPIPYEDASHDRTIGNFGSKSASTFEDVNIFFDDANASSSLPVHFHLTFLISNLYKGDNVKVRLGRTLL